MKRLLAFVVLPLLIAGVWAYALKWPVPSDPLPARYQGTFLLYRFEPPQGVTMPNPYVPGHMWYYTFNADSSYRISVEVTDGYEMSRHEGVVRLGEGQSLTLDQVSSNRREERLPYRYGTIWDRDDKGREVLVLTSVDEGYRLFLRRVERSAE